MFDSTKDSGVSVPPWLVGTPQGLRVYAPAKINLNLLVGARRSDGYHPVDSCIAKITLYDQIDLQPRDDGNITLTCEGFPCGSAEKNLAHRAAVLMAADRETPGVDMRLVKQIPPGGGLGGGSSDAASVLAGLNELWKLKLTKVALHEIAAELGSDVPLFLGNTASRVTGRGERLEPIDVFSFWAVLILPGLHCPTPEVYRAFDAEPTPRFAQLDTSLLAQPPSKWRDQLENHLANPACRVCPALGKLHRRLSNILPLPVHLSGSGSSLFVLCDEKAEAEQIMDAMPAEVKSGCRVVRKNPW